MVSGEAQAAVERARTLRYDPRAPLRALARCAPASLHLLLARGWGSSRSANHAPNLRESAAWDHSPAMHAALWRVFCLPWADASRRGAGMGQKQSSAAPEATFERAPSGGIPRVSSSSRSSRQAPLPGESGLQQVPPMHILKAAAEATSGSRGNSIDWQRTESSGSAPRLSTDSGKMRRMHSLPGDSKQVVAPMSVLRAAAERSDANNSRGNSFDFQRAGSSGSTGPRLSIDGKSHRMPALPGDSGQVVPPMNVLRAASMRAQ